MLIVFGFRLTEEIEQTKIPLNPLYHQYELVKFWELGFDKKSKAQSGTKTIRSFIMEESIQELNMILQEYMDQMSLVGFPSSHVATSTSFVS